MNKILISACLALATLSASAFDFKVLSLMTGSDLQLADAITVTNNTTGALYKRPNGNLGYANSYSNVVSGSVVVNSNAYVPPWANAVETLPQGDGLVHAGMALTVMCYATNAATTNPVTIILERSGDGVTFDDRSTFTAVTAASITNCLQTNMPSSFFVGTKVIRIKTAASTTVSGSVGNTFVSKVYLSGWSP